MHCWFSNVIFNTELRCCVILYFLLIKILYVVLLKISQKVLLCSFKCNAKHTKLTCEPRFGQSEYLNCKLPHASMSSNLTTKKLTIMFLFSIFTVIITELQFVYLIRKTSIGMPNATETELLLLKVGNYGYSKS